MASNTTLPCGYDNTSGHTNVADAEWDKDVRIIVLWVQITIGIIGGLVVISWLWINKRRKSRVNVIFMHVTLADLLVMVASLCQVIWEMYDRTWLAGDAMCRIIKFYQSFTMLGSTNMLVMLSIDRHQAIRSPLREPPKVWKIASICWLLAALLSIPMLFLFHTTFITIQDSPFYDQTVCESVFRCKPDSHRQAFLTSMALMHVFLPCIAICTCYLRIYLKISQKAREATSDVTSLKPGAIHLHSTASNLPRAKIKTLKMTVVIVTVFLLCGLPYHIIELLFNFWKHYYVPKVVTGIMLALPAAHSAINPYIFLFFNVTCADVKGAVRPNDRRAYTEHRERTIHTHAQHDVTKSDHHSSDVNIHGKSHGTRTRSPYLPMKTLK